MNCFDTLFHSDFLALWRAHHPSFYLLCVPIIDPSFTFTLSPTKYLAIIVLKDPEENDQMVNKILSRLQPKNYFKSNIIFQKETFVNHKT